MPRSRVCRPAAAFTRPAALESPYKGEFTPQDWFRFENSADGEDTTHIYIYDVIGGWFGTSADEMLYQLKNVDTSTITLHINSPGGDVFDGVAIYNALRAHKAEVNVIVDALAASAASFVAQAGDSIVMNTGSMMMIHDASGASYDNAEGHRKTSDILDKVSNSIAAIYASRAGDTQEVWRTTMKAEAWYSAQEAVDAGLADSVSATPATVNPSDKFDLSIFNYAGRGAAPSPVALMNQAKKEAQVAPKNESESTSEVPKEPEAPAAPEETDEEKAAREATEAAAAADALKNQAKPTDATLPVVVNLDGKPSNSLAAVQAHINTLEGFFKDQTEANRKGFVEQLARDNKISAAQIPKLTAYAVGLGTEGYKAWSETWADTPPNSAFAKNVTGGTSNHSGEDTTQTALEQKIETAKAIVLRHTNSGMKEDQIKLSASYKFLEANNAL